MADETIYDPDDIETEIPDLPEGEIDQSLPEGEGLTKWQIAAALLHLKRVLARQKARRQARRARRKERRKGPPNILCIMGDDIGIHNLSCYNHGIQGFQTPNIDRLAIEGALFTDAYGQNSCTAGRSAMMMGMSPFRMGMLKIGLPGDTHGFPEWAPTIADLLKEKGYRTGQFGKNHFGDQNSHLPTVHGFDKFFGNLYHLNAQEEPETEHYPQDPEFLAKYGPRGVLECEAADRAPVLPGRGEDPRWGPVGNQRITDTGPLTRERMQGFDDDEVYPRTEKFIRDAVKAKEPFFVWACPSRVHVWTRLKPESQGVTGLNVYCDGLVEHDKFVGRLLKLLDDLKITNNTCVLYNTDNGAEAMTWPDGGVTPFHGEKGTTWEGGFRVPMLMRWPGVIEPGTIINEMVAMEDLLPTFLDAAGEPDIVDKLKAGYGGKRRNRTWKIHPDGKSLLPFLLGETDEPPRESFLYWDQTGRLNAIRWGQWKVSFAMLEGNMATGIRTVPPFPSITNLRMDPYEVMAHESMTHFRWFADQAWIFAPIGEVIAEFMKSIPGYPIQYGSTWGPADLNYNTVRLAEFVAQFSDKKLMQLSEPMD